MAKIRLKKNNVIVRNFLKIALFCFLAVCIAAFFINQYAVRVIETEVLQSNANTAANLQERTKEVLYQCRSIAAYLATDTMAQSFFWSEQPGRVYANFYLQLQNKLNAYAQGIDYIDSIYLYSPVSQKIIASGQAAPVSDAEDFRDMGWLENLEQVQDDIRCFSRSIRNEFDYPHVYTMILHRYLTGVESVVVVNVDLQKLFKTVASRSDGCYIVDGKERIILRRIKTALYEPMDSVPRMGAFRLEEKRFSCIGKDSEGAYAFSQLYSSTDDLYYISISSQDEYFGRLAKTSWLVVIGAVFVALTLCLAGLLFTFKNTVDFLTKKQKVNAGEVTQYYVTGSHEGIVSPEVFDLVQHERERRKSLAQAYSASDLFASRIACGECGNLYGRKIWNSTSKYRRIVWQCNGKYSKRQGCAACQTPHLSEIQIKKAFVGTFNACIRNKDEILTGCREAMAVVCDVGKLEESAAGYREECEVAAELIRKCIEENAHVSIRPETYQDRYHSLNERYKAVREKLNAVEREISDRTVKRKRMETFLKQLSRSNELLTEFDEGLWNTMLDSLTVYSYDKVVFQFRDGSKVVWKIEK